MQKSSFYLAVFIFLAGLLAVYSNHFDNGFHFDDSHSVLNNIYIQNIRNIPLFFKDGTTFSSLPSNQSYRPVVTSTLAIDYWLGGGLEPFYFHLSTFIVFLLQGVLMFFLFRKIFSIASFGVNLFFVSLFAVAWYLFHPANAETINYVIARSDSLSTFFVLLAFVMYMYSPVSKKYYLYLLPVVIGSLAKIPSIMFAPLLLVYILLFEKQISFAGIFKKENFSGLVSVCLAAIPAFLVSAALYVFVQKMEPDTWTPGGTSPYLYFITQPYIIFHYFRTFFFPLWLSADTDWTVFDSVLDPKAIGGFAFVLLLFVFALVISKNQKLRPVSFGILWFFIALIPSSSIIPLSEVMNDHRLFFPYVGLVIAVVGGMYVIVQNKMNSGDISASAIVLFSILFLAPYAYGTVQRNKVWDTDESLWYDVTVKSPRNARGLMNYGLVLMARADYKGAEKYFSDALQLWPYYPYLHVNMGILKNATGHPAEAEQHFKNAISYRPDVPEFYYFYGDFLHKNQRDAEAITLLNKALELSGAQISARYLLMEIYLNNADAGKLNALAHATLNVLPNDPKALYYLEAIKGKKTKLEVAEENAKSNLTAENYLNLSLEYYNAGRYEDCINACREALKLKPDFDLAYNNICSAYNMLGDWDKAIEAGEAAVRLNPGNQLAKNNLIYAQQSKAANKK